MAQPVELAGKGKGAQALGPCKNILNQLFPNGVSTIPDVTLFEAELRGLKALDGFFFFLIHFAFDQNLSKNPPGGEKRRIYANRAISSGFNHWYFGGGGIAAVSIGGG